jgi:hypothetical protein
MHKFIFFLFFKSGAQSLLIRPMFLLLKNYFWRPDPSNSAYVSYCFKVRGAYLSFSPNLLINPTFWERSIDPSYSAYFTYYIKREAKTLIIKSIFSIFWDGILNLSSSAYFSWFLKDLARRFLFDYFLCNAREGPRPFLFSLFFLYYFE